MEKNFFNAFACHDHKCENETNDFNNFENRDFKLQNESRYIGCTTLFLTKLQLSLNFQCSNINKGFHSVQLRVSIGVTEYVIVVFRAAMFRLTSRTVNT